MQIDINIASIVGSFVVLLVGIVAFFTRQSFARLERVEKDRTQTYLDMATIKKELDMFKADHERMREEMQKHENKIESLVEKFPEMVAQSVRPLFDSIKIELGYLKESMNELKK